mgnify:CR=1 FL=1
MPRTAVPHTAAHLGRRALDLMLPPQCLACDTLVDTPGSLCPRCWYTIGFLAPPWCLRCGRPFALDPGDGAQCGACTAQPPGWDRGRAVMRYDAHSRDLVLGFKHADRTEAAPAFGQWLARAGGALVTEADAVVPVPLHPWRLFRRRYNQAALLARALGRSGGRPVLPDLLVRRRATPSQRGLTPAGRERNVRGAFAVRRPALAEGRRLLLVDDVMTTGATLSACARRLRQAGAGGVDVLTLARVLPEA